jgi:hypothetical protein
MRTTLQKPWLPPHETANLGWAIAADSSGQTPASRRGVGYAYPTGVDGTRFRRGMHLAHVGGVARHTNAIHPSPLCCRRTCLGDLLPGAGQVRGSSPGESLEVLLIADRACAGSSGR